MLSVDLEVSHISVRFGGILAVDDVSLHAEAGRITGLIGPNGAGKTTLFNACTGLVRPTSGTVRLGAEDLTRLRPAGRARRGLGRTFQRMELFDALSVRDNLDVASAAFHSGSHPLGLLRTPRAERTVIAERTADALRRTGLEAIADRLAGDLSTGERRMVELARAMATPFSFLLLDEPSSGLDVTETQEFGTVLRDWVAQTGNGILLVEHDMALVSQICEQIAVLDFGKIVYQGATAAALASEVVRSAYLGEATLA